jgi:hypothetical protein
MQGEAIRGRCGAVALAVLAPYHATPQPNETLAAVVASGSNARSIYGAIGLRKDWLLLVGLLVCPVSRERGCSLLDRSFNDRHEIPEE